MIYIVFNEVWNKLTKSSNFQLKFPSIKFIKPIEYNYENYKNKHKKASSGVSLDNGFSVPNYRNEES